MFLMDQLRICLMKKWKLKDFLTYFLPNLSTFPVLTPINQKRFCDI